MRNPGIDVAPGGRSNLRELTRGELAWAAHWSGSVEQQYYENGRAIVYVLRKVSHHKRQSVNCPADYQALWERNNYSSCLGV
jgi:hypothetical protein